MKKILFSIIFLFTCLLCTSLPINAASKNQASLKTLLTTSLTSTLTTAVISDQLKRPWSLAFLPNDNYLVTERSGVLRIVDEEGVVSAPIQGLPSISAIGQGGLLDVVLHPRFKNNGFIYLSYVAGDSGVGYSTEVIRAVLSASMPPDSLASSAQDTFYKSRQYSLTGLKKLFVALPKVQGGRHFGGRLAFDKEGYLLISLGDRGERTHSQNLQTHHGSMIRLRDNGDVPESNPFIDHKTALPEIYSYGHRNVQGLAMHPITGEMWSHEHGPQGGDEVNKLAPGKNYGWPVISYGAEYGSGLPIGQGIKAVGIEQPLYYWTPSIAPSGMAFFNDDILVGSLKFQLLSILSIPKQAANKQTIMAQPKNVPKLFDEVRLFERRFGRIRDVRVKDSKTFYLLTDASRGKLVRVTKKTQ
jgi:glucose/arabinose dehydrogenase